MHVRAGAVATAFEAVSKQLHAARAAPGRDAAGGKFLRSWAHFALCDAKRTAAIEGHFEPCKPGMRRHAVHRARACTRRDECTSLRRAVEKTLFLCGLLNALRLRARWFRDDEGISCPTDAPPTAARADPGPENNCVRVLTVEKTVIRFRHNTRLNRSE
jgi:hypothetical protein